MKITECIFEHYAKKISRLTSIDTISATVAAGQNSGNFHLPFVSILSNVTQYKLVIQFKKIG